MVAVSLSRVLNDSRDIWPMASEGTRAPADFRGDLDDAAGAGPAELFVAGCGAVSCSHSRLRRLDSRAIGATLWLSAVFGATPWCQGHPVGYRYFWGDPVQRRLRGHPFASCGYLGANSIHGTGVTMRFTTSLFLLCGLAISSQPASAQCIYRSGLYPSAGGAWPGHIMAPVDVHSGPHMRAGHLLSNNTGSLTTAETELVFGGFSHVDELAYQLEIVLNEICLDLHYNYAHNVDFQVTYAEAWELLQMARFMHTAEHNHDRAAMKSRLSGADLLFHHVQDDLRGWTRQERRQIGYLGVQTKIELAERLLHHLMQDVGVHPEVVTEQAPPPGAVELAPAPAGPPLPRLDR